MSEFNYLREKQRMLNSIGRTSEACVGAECKSCLLSMDRNGKHMNCVRFEMEYPNEATEAMRKWTKEHPTIKDILLEKFPDVPLNYKGVPYICAIDLGFFDECISDCAACWDTEVTK